MKYFVDVDSDESENEFPLQNTDTEEILPNECTGNSTSYMEQYNGTSPEQNITSGKNYLHIIDV